MFFYSDLFSQTSRNFDPRLLSRTAKNFQRPKWNDIFFFFLSYMKCIKNTFLLALQFFLTATDHLCIDFSEALVEVGRRSRSYTRPSMHLPKKLHLLVGIHPQTHAWDKVSGCVMLSYDCNGIPFLPLNYGLEKETQKCGTKTLRTVVSGWVSNSISPPAHMNRDTSTGSPPLGSAVTMHKERFMEPIKNIWFKAQVVLLKYA